MTSIEYILCIYSQVEDIVEVKTARLFQNGGSQAVRLPSEFRFQGNHVYIRRDESTGDVILSAHPRLSWAEFMELRRTLGAVPEDFLRERFQTTEARDPFADWQD